MSKSPVRLIPAQPHADDEGQSYTRRIPWGWIILVAGVVISTAVFYHMRESRKAEVLRSKILLLHRKELGEVSTKYQALRNKLENWILSATTDSVRRDYVDPELKIAGLRSQKGLYLRLRFNSAISRTKIATGATTAKADAIAQCLGLQPAWVRELYQLGEFLLPEWLKDVHSSNTVMRLRVIDDELSRRIQRDLPRVRELLEPDWFLLVLQHGETRHDEPVDVFLWDMSNGKSLLRARIKSQGLLVPLRFGSKDIPMSPRTPSTSSQQSTADDCSIAAAIKTMTGAETSPAPATNEPEGTPTFKKQKENPSLTLFY